MSRHPRGSGVLQPGAGTVPGATRKVLVESGHNLNRFGVVSAPDPGKAGPMATDYDQPRTDDSDLGEDSLEELKARRDQQAGAVDVDEAELAESLELPGADLSGEELTVR